MHHDDSDLFLLDLPSDPELHLEIVRAVALLAPLAACGFGPRSSDALLWLECLSLPAGFLLSIENGPIEISVLIAIRAYFLG